MCEVEDFCTTWPHLPNASVTVGEFQHLLQGLIAFRNMISIVSLVESQTRHDVTPHTLFHSLSNLVPRAFSSTIFKMADIRHFENRRGEGPGDEVDSKPKDARLLSNLQNNDA